MSAQVGGATSGDLLFGRLVDELHAGEIAELATAAALGLAALLAQLDYDR